MMRIAPILLLLSSHALAGMGKDVQERINRDAAAKKTLVAHVIVCLADNQHQGIVPVTPGLGNGQDAGSNLYWGARYGVKTYLLGSGWKRVPDESPLPQGVLDRLVLQNKIRRGKEEIEVRLVAEAWDGREIKKATLRFLNLAAGREGNAHLVAWVGHDGLMDFELKEKIEPATDAQPRSAAVLACLSRDYFKDVLAGAGAHALLLTTGLMCPEAYTLDAVLRAWFSGADARATREAAARAYRRYQKCPLRAARELFTGEP